MSADVKAEVFAYLDSLPRSDLLTGWELFSEINSRTGIKTYPETILHYCREYADRSGANFRCVDKARSLYHFTPGVKLGKAIA